MYHPSTMVMCCVRAQATEDLLAFTIRHTSGVICVSLEEKRLEVRGVDSSLDVATRMRPTVCRTPNSAFSRPSWLCGFSAAVQLSEAKRVEACLGLSVTVFSSPTLGIGVTPPATPNFRCVCAGAALAPDGGKQRGSQNDSLRDHG